MKTILIVEDDPTIHGLIRDLLEEDYHLVSAYSGTEGLLQFEKEAPDLVLLDLMLPGLSGEDLLAKIRATSKLPVLVLTAKVEVDSLVKLLSMGADDYLSKPFHPKELRARIGVQLRKAQPESQDASILRQGEICLKEDSHEVFLSGESVYFTQTEYAILRLFLKNPGRVFSKEAIYESVWGDSFYGDNNTVSVHISRLRSKLTAYGPDPIQTVWGLGFKFLPKKEG